MDNLAFEVFKEGLNDVCQFLWDIILTFPERGGGKAVECFFEIKNTTLNGIFHAGSARVCVLFEATLLLAAQGNKGCGDILKDDAAEDLAGKGHQCDASPAVAVFKFSRIWQLHDDFRLPIIQYPLSVPYLLKDGLENVWCLLFLQIQHICTYIPSPTAILQFVCGIVSLF